MSDAADFVVAFLGPVVSVLGFGAGILVGFALLREIR